MYLKKPDHQKKLLEELNYCVQNAEPLRLKRENYGVFEAFERGFLHASKEPTLINILKHYNVYTTAFLLWE